jgi:GT2 family glycosyltransferase
MADLPDGWWGCLMDLDTMFLTPDAGIILYEYTKLYPDTGLFTCWTNRIHPLAHHQLLNGHVSENDRVRDHIAIAKERKAQLYKVKELTSEVSGFLMMIKKETWKEIKFIESGRALGVDNDYCWKLLAAGKSIRRMEGLYIWHSYRMENGITNKAHLV